MSNAESLFLSKKLARICVRLATTDLLNERLCNWLHEVDAGKLEAIKVEVAETGANATLEFQKRLGEILKEFGVENPL